MSSKYAFLIGIDTYNDEFPKLRYAVSDIELIKEKLVQISNFDHFDIIDLTDNTAKTPIWENILYEFENLIKKVEENDTLLIYFSGHGFSYTDKDYLVPRNGTKKYIERSCISSMDFISKICDKNVHNTLIIIDACRNIVSTGERGFSNFPSNIIEFNEIHNIITIFSCERGQVSKESEAFGHGIFSYYFADAFENFLSKNPGEISVFDLFNYIKEKVVEETKTSQSPEINISNLDEFRSTASNFIITSKKETADKYIADIKLWIGNIMSNPSEILTVSMEVPIPNSIVKQVTSEVLKEVVGKPRFSFQAESKSEVSIVRISYTAKKD